MSESSPSYTTLLLTCDFNKFPICACFLWYKTLYPEKVPSGIEGQKATETRKLEFWSEISSEKDLDQKGEI